ncbi:MAG: thioredoxin-disulfide reductase [Clostridia bacterium]|nr:thioredoxin-disulfide reductase [Clostridia bacterium]
MEKIYDVIIVGGGPAGYTSALYGARAGLSVLLIEKLYAGGQMATTDVIENYPGFEEGIGGFELALKIKAQAEKFGVETKLIEVKAIELNGNVKKVITSDGEFKSKTIIIATGANPKNLGVKNEEKFLSKGIHYCASCDGMFYRNKKVVVVGGGDTAVSDVLLLSRIAKEVVLVHRRDTLRATKVYHKGLEEIKNLTFTFNSTIKEIVGEDKFSGIIIENVKTKETKKIDCDGLFVSIGRNPATMLVEGQVNTNDAGYIIADETTKTNVLGVYAVGDVRTKPLRQIVTAVADGANAIFYIETYLETLKQNN